VPYIESEQYYEQTYGTSKSHWHINEPAPP
jgi:hypothetical protein